MSESGFLLFITYFVALWLGVSYLLATLSGWRRAARSYRAPERPSAGTSFVMRSGRMNLAYYGGTLNLVTDSHGLYVSLVPLFAFAAPRLFIPWSDISASPGTLHLRQGIALAFVQTPGVTLVVGRRLGTALLETGPIRPPAA